MKKTSGEKVWEFLPGFLAWSAIITMLILSLVAPFTAAIMMLAFTVYWLLKVITVSVYLIVGYRSFRREIKIDWRQRLEKDYPSNYRSINHILIVPTYKEDISILRRTLDAIAESNFPLDQVIVVLAFEERDRVLAPEYAPILTREYQKYFRRYITTFHPADIPGEVKGKGPNITWAARQAVEALKSESLDPTKVVVTTLDADNRVDRQYLANLTWAYLNEPEPATKSYQPIPMFFNNIHQVPLSVKLVALGSTFWQLIQSMRPHFLRNFSAHAQSLDVLIKTDFWSVTTVVEDGHQYWRTFFTLKGDHEVVPIFVPIYMDAVQGESLYDTLREQYLQRRRWYWGVSDLPYVWAQAIKDKTIPFFQKWLQFYRLFESHFSLSIQSFVLIIGWMPIIFHPEIQETVIGYNFTIIYRLLLSAAWIGMIATMTLSVFIVPPRPVSRPRRLFGLVKEWLFTPLVLPLVTIFYSSLPALDSQTRMMLNKPFTVFNVTKKAAIPSNQFHQNQN